MSERPLPAPDQPTPDAKTPAVSTSAVANLLGGGQSRSGAERDHVETLKLGTAKCVLTTPADDPALPEIRAAVEAGYARSRDFFGMELPGAPFETVIVTDPGAMGRLLGTTCPTWMCGSCDKNGLVVAHHPSILLEGCDPLPVRFERIVAHEICHLFVHRLGGAPAWIHEGAAQFVAGQEKPNGKKYLAKLADNEVFYAYRSVDARPAIEKGGYNASLYFFQRLHAEFGRERLFELWKGEKSESLDDRFLRVLGSKPRDLAKKYATDDVDLPPQPEPKN